MKRLALLCILLPVMTVVNAVEKNDFAYGYSLEVDGDGAIYTLNLNADIYQGLTRPDRGDLRIFNSRGESVPHYLRRAETHVVKKQPDEILKLFPLYDSKNEAQVGAGYNVHITTSETGAIIDMNYGKGDPSDRKLSGYVIDASHVSDDRRISEILFTWPAEHKDFVVRVNLEGSQDLNDWRTLVTGNVLSNLHYGEHTLIKDHIDLAAGRYKYYRLTWHGNNPVSLDKVTARFPDVWSDQPRQWSRFPLSRHDGENNYYYFDTASVLPADRLRINNLQRNTLVRVAIESAQKQEGPWYTRYSGLLYDLQHGSERVTNPTINLSTTTDRYWRIQVLDAEGRLGAKPALELGWFPEQLLFVAQGESPFTLAYGSASVDRLVTPLQHLLSNEDELKKQGKLIKSARLGSIVQLGDESKLQPPRPPTDWKQYLLWTVLVAGVALLALMVIRLYKQMEQTKPEE